jgi:hypothetical protein
MISGMFAAGLKPGSLFTTIASNLTDSAAKMWPKAESPNRGTPTTAPMYVTLEIAS